jgi:hypothetical protein
MADQTLINEITNDPLGRGYSGMMDSEIYTSLTTENISVPYTRFISLRGCASVLSDIEYATFKAFLTTVAGYGDRYTDMVNMLSLPCNDDGDTGGLDFGCNDVRSLIDNFGIIEGMSTAATNLKALAEHNIGRMAQLGGSWRLLDIIRARRA